MMQDARIDELVQMVKRLEHKLVNVQPATHRVDVALDAASPSNFYRGMDGDDVLAYGGIFVATYAKLPPLGATITLGMQFPGGARCEVLAVVAWTQDDLGEMAPAGFGARITQASPEARAMITEFVRAREPIVRD
jgi:hypothetical protein